MGAPPKGKCHLGSGLNQRDRAAALGNARASHPAKPTKIFYCRGVYRCCEAFPLGFECNEKLRIDSAKIKEQHNRPRFRAPCRMSHIMPHGSHLVGLRVLCSHDNAPQATTYRAEWPMLDQRDVAGRGASKFSRRDRRARRGCRVRVEVCQLCATPGTQHPERARKRHQDAP